MAPRHLVLPELLRSERDSGTRLRTSAGNRVVRFLGALCDFSNMGTGHPYAPALRESANKGEATASGDAGVPGEVAGFGG